MIETATPEPAERRGSPRVPVGWSGQYVIPSRPDLGWGDCLVVDASETGLGLVLFGPWPDDVPHEVEVLVRLEPRAQGEPFELLGATRNLRPSNVGELRIGIEFPNRDGAALLSYLGSFARNATVR